MKRRRKLDWGEWAYRALMVILFFLILAFCARYGGGMG